MIQNKGGRNWGNPNNNSNNNNSSSDNNNNNNNNNKKKKSNNKSNNSSIIMIIPRTRTGTHRANRASAPQQLVRVRPHQCGLHVRARKSRPRFVALLFQGRVELPNHNRPVCTGRGEASYLRQRRPDFVGRVKADVLYVDRDPVAKLEIGRLLAPTLLLQKKGLRQWRHNSLIRHCMSHLQPRESRGPQRAALFRR